MEKQLWKAANKMRKNIDAGEYKHVVLGLIFLKYISDSFEELHKKLVEEVKIKKRKEMNTLKVKLEHCFGIQKLEYEFDFSKRNSVLIYAPNGVMKTSFAKTFECIANGEKPCDRIYKDRKTICEITSDTNQIPPECIFIANAESGINTDSKITTFLASKELKEQYDKIYQVLDKERNDFVTRLREISKSTDCENEFVSTFQKNEKENLFTCLLSLKKQIEENNTLFDFRYNDIFDKKGNVEKFLGKNKDLIKQYFDHYSDLLNKSDFFKSNGKGVPFGTYQANALITSVEDDSFFEAKHKLVLSNKQEITSTEQLKELVTTELNKILDDEKLKKAFDKIDSAIGKNTELRSFKAVLEKDKSIIPRLLDYNDFKKQVWYGYLHALDKETIKLINIYKKNEAEISKLLKKAKEENKIWNEIIGIYNERFHVPFKVTIKNQEDVILKQETANLEFQYNDVNGQPIDKKRDELLQILSKGEQRALYILQILFEIEARKKSESENIIILDDIADSFDYKNKYAIIEYIRDLNNDPRFKQIILTHNFDFYRTVDSRLNLKDSVFMTTQDSNGNIELKRGKYRRDVFENYFTEKAREPKIFVSLIPFVRNIIEYTKGHESTEYETLTCCLHMKSATEEISANGICEILKKNISHCGCLSINFGCTKISNLILQTAENILNEDSIDEILLENKLVLSIAIRLLAERYIIFRLGDKVDIDKIQVDQTRELINKYKEHYSSELQIIKILERVNLMTPENIHVNTFMYEPLIDMSVNHLVNLYKDIRNLEKV